MLRLRGDDRFASVTAPLSMTVVIGLVPSVAEAGIIFGGADGTAEAVLVRSRVGRQRIS